MLPTTTSIRERHPSGGPGLFVLEDVLHALPTLTERYAGQVQTIYLDPPFATGESFQVRLGKGRAITLPAYEDKLSGEAYIELMRAVLTGCRTLLSSEGSLFLHVDYRMSAHMRLLLDEIFGAGNFVNEIIWMYRSGGRSKKHFARKHDTIFLYRKSPQQYFNIEAVGIPRGPDRRNHMKRSIDEQGRVCFSIRSGGKLYTYYEDTLVFPTDVWTDIEHLHQRDPERVGYATQKPEALLKRILLSCSRPGDLVADFFAGSGTTAAVAAGLGRRFLCCDRSPVAMHVLRKRLLERDNAISMLEVQEPFLLEYPATEAAFAIEAEWDGKSCTLHAVSEEDTALLVAYCAIGDLKEGAFATHAHAFYPRLPITLRAEGLTSPALQVGLVDGRQGFFRL